MTHHTLSRRRLFAGTMHLAVIGAAPFVLHACTKEEFSCANISGLSREDLELRTELDYVDRSPYEDAKTCSNCAFFVKGPKNQCGNCTLVKGPIHPLGYCSSWAAKA